MKEKPQRDVGGLKNKTWDQDFEAIVWATSVLDDKIDATSELESWLPSPF